MKWSWSFKFVYIRCLATEIKADTSIPHIAGLLGWERGQGMHISNSFSMLCFCCCSKGTRRELFLLITPWLWAYFYEEIRMHIKLRSRHWDGHCRRRENSFVFPGLRAGLQLACNARRSKERKARRLSCSTALEMLKQEDCEFESSLAYTGLFPKHITVIN